MILLHYNNDIIEHVPLFSPDHPVETAEEVLADVSTCTSAIIVPIILLVHIIRQHLHYCTRIGNWMSKSPPGLHNSEIYATEMHWVNCVIHK